MNLVRFRFSILRCTYLEEPFQHVHLLPTLRETTLQSDRQQTCPELGITFPCAALRYSHAKLSGSRQTERMDSNHQDLVYDQAVPSYLHFPNNPDPRVSKVFIVLCLPLSDFHGDVVSFTRMRYQSVKLANEYVGNCIRFSTSRFHSNLFLLRTYSRKKGGHETKKKAKTSNQQALQGSPCLARL